MKDLCLQDNTDFGDKAKRLGEGQEVDDEVGEKEEIMYHGAKPFSETSAPLNS